MGSIENSLRRKWQDYGGRMAANAEHSFYEVFHNLFQDSELEIIKNPKQFNNIYTEVQLDQEELNQIYVPQKPINKHGIKPDFLIRNNDSGKEIYIEIKRQDGWVENKKT